jgi:hypothetical protein
MKFPPIATVIVLGQWREMLLPSLGEAWDRGSPAASDAELRILHA